MDASRYQADDTLRDGTPVEVRALQPGDREQMKQALLRMSGDSIVRRFFSPRPTFSESEVARFLKVDFVDHVALVAVVDAQIVGGARYVTLSPGRAELACAVEDAWQGRGLGKVLLRHLGILARAGGIREAVADVLADNAPMLKLLRGAGLPITSAREPGAMQLVVSLAGGDAAVPSPARPVP